jgi:hypothetical protein
MGLSFLSPPLPRGSRAGGYFQAEIRRMQGYRARRGLTRCGRRPEIRKISIWKVANEAKAEHADPSGENGRLHMANRVNHQDIVRKVLEEKAVDFAAVGKVVAEIGPALSLADEGWEGFCGTMRTFFHCFIIVNPNPPPVWGATTTVETE